MGTSSDPPHQKTTRACAQCGLPVPRRRLALRNDSQEYCCYGCYLMHSLTGARGDEARPTLFLARLGFAAFLAMNAQMFTWVLYAEDLPFLFPVEVESRQTINYLVFILSLPVYLLIGFPFLRNAIRELRMLAPGVDSLIAIGTTSAFLYSVYSTFRGSLTIYYDTAVMVLVLVTFGRYLEATARLKAKDALGKLGSAASAVARVVCNGIDRELAADAVPKGALVKVLPGEQVPVDGKVLEGESTVDESLLTGEANPVKKGVGDGVLGGSINHDGFLLVESTKVAGEMYLGQLHRLMAEILRTRPPSQELGDRIARYFTPGIILVAIGTAVVWWIIAGPSTGLLIGLSVLLIACPCGLEIGAALAASIGYAKAAHHGVIAKSFGVLERVGKTNSVFIDKTGTLTTGKTSVQKLVLAPSWKGGRSEVLELVAALESRSEHPLARAFVEYAGGCKVHTRELLTFHNAPGFGISGVVKDREGVPVYVSVSRKAVDSSSQNFEIQELDPSLSASYIYINNTFSGTVWFSDTIRPTAKEAVNRLGKLGARIAVLSGDGPLATSCVAGGAGIEESWGALTPVQKVSFVTQAKRNGREVCMVGDGINDAAALAAADIGVTLGSSTSFARSASDITVIDSDLTKLPWIIQYSRRISSAIRWNFLWVFLYNSIGLGLAVAGQIRPVFAALAMVISSALVIANSSRLARDDFEAWQGLPCRRG